MVAFNFQPRFANAVASGIKCQTIRKTARCKPGDRLQFYTGQRTAGCRKLGEGVCTRVRPVCIRWMGMTLDGLLIPAGDALRDDIIDRDNDFARRDGFPGFIEMMDWFHCRYGLPFDGFLIEWRLD